MLQIDDDLAQKIENDGFVIIKDVFSKNEVRKLREIVKNHFGDKGIPAFSGLTQPNAAAEVPEISWLFYHPQILTIMRNLLRQEEIVFTSHCDVHSGILSAWHKDDGMTVMDGGYFDQPMYKNKDCRVYKVGIYLQNHIYNNGGLTVRKGSHKFPSLDQGEEVYLKTHTGDVVVFDVRLTHTGQREVVPVPLMKEPIKLFRKVLNRLFRIDSPKINYFFKETYDNLSGKKLSIFFTYGLPDEYTRRFAVNNMKRQITQNQSKEIFMPPSTRKMLLDNKVILAEDYFTELV